MDAVVKIGFGMVGFFTKFVFVDHMCFIFVNDECPAKIDLSIPNAIVAISLLFMFGNCRFMQLLFRNQYMPLFMERILDGFFTSYLTDVCIRQLWIPMLNIVYTLCTHSSMFLLNVSRTDLSGNFIKPLAHWMRRDAMDVFRFVLALLFVYTMLQVTGTVGVLWRKYFEWFGKAPGDDMLWEDSPTLLLGDHAEPNVVMPSKIESIFKRPGRGSSPLRLKRPHGRRVTFNI